jgi:putative holliday junction resolvase
MRILGIDYGSKRVGLALSDERHQFAMPLIVLNNTKNLLNDILKIIKEKNIEEIVMGESRNYEGEANAILADSLRFKTELESKDLKVHLEPEFMTSHHAARFQGKNEMLDASAAALILQSFLDRKENKG